MALPQQSQMRNWRKPHSPVVGTWQKEDFRQAEEQKDQDTQEGKSQEGPGYPGREEPSRKSQEGDKDDQSQKRESWWFWLVSS